MNFMRLKKLPSVEEVIQHYPLSDVAHQRVMQDRKEINDILAGRDDRLLMIVGPCSAWPELAVYEYAERLLALNAEVKHALKIVMRMYIQKPRTTKGWTGPINQPNPFADADVSAGIHTARNMMVKVVEMGLPIADECLFTHNTRVFSELVSWFAIGARSSEDHEHRIFASKANCAVGLKNPTHGSLDIAVNSIIAAQHSHHAAIDGYEIQTFGNPYAHLVLRGGNKQPNYSVSHLTEVHQHMVAHQVKNPAVLMDVSHDNCLVNGKKNHARQPDIIFEVMDYLDTHPELKKIMKGFMLESFIKEGNQNIEQCTPESIDLGGLSITDPCLGWENTALLLRELAQRVKP